MNAREYEALSDEYLTHEARSLYVLCLRQHMDFSTGLVGTARRRVSYQQFKEHLSVSRPRRSTKPPFIPSLQQLRGFVDELVRVGLVERLPIQHRQDPMVFRLPLATADANPLLFRPNEEQHLSNKEQQQKEQHQEQQSETPLNQGINPQEQQEEQHQEQHLSNKEEQHTSVTSVNTSHTNANAHEDFAEPISTADEFDARFAEPASDDCCPPATDNRGRKFSMFAQWQPDHTFTDQAFTLGLDLRSLDMDQGEHIEQALEEFKTWWIESRPSAANTQRLWQQKFIQTSLKREFEKHNNNSYGANHGNGHSKNTGKYQPSAVTKPFTAEDFDLDATW
ncbi:DnaT-like ssDNA-binding domain-containing protein [uncultured Endozoicomonas sp.]|uniref:DnaT-like ssDNA-binding domain-containing protein n=1 Tax=uncultured Endozoicomonas sp. TaxID=432652 RepID=UPI002615DBAF|nr:DnaT-like ssDNA-binding domain-containing protein [uncultured Endozoicomonas sp.]